MTATQQLTDNQKSTIGLIYYCAKNGLEFSQALMEDDNLPSFIKVNFALMWQMNFGRIKSQLDKSLSVNAGFSDQIQNSDTQGLHQVISAYLKMSPENREAVEAMFDTLNKNEKIQVEVREI